MKNGTSNGVASETETDGAASKTEDVSNFSVNFRGPSLLKQLLTLLRLVEVPDKVTKTIAATSKLLTLFIMITF